MPDWQASRPVRGGAEASARGDPRARRRGQWGEARPQTPVAQAALGRATSRARSTPRRGGVHVKDPLAPRNARRRSCLHGRNDYFLGRDGVGCARRARRSTRWTCASTAFPRPHQTISYTDDLSVYDEEIGGHRVIIRCERRGRADRLAGTLDGRPRRATLWAHRHQGSLAGLITIRRDGWRCGRWPRLAPGAMTPSQWALV